MITNAAITAVNDTTGQPIRLLSWSVMRSIAQTFATADFKLKLDADIRFQDEISMQVIGASVSLPLFAGIVTRIETDDGNTLSISCESQAGILARSDAEPDDWTYNQAREMIESVAGDFEIDVAFDDRLPASTVTGACIDPGTRALSVIVDVCRRAGWVVTDDPGGGGLMITSVGSESFDTVLERGRPPLESLRMNATDNRIAETYANRQMPGKKRKGKKTVADIDLWGSATDEYARPGTRRYLRSNTAENVNELDYLAAATSLAEGAGGISITAQVVGILEPISGLPWQPNRLVTVRDPDRRIDNYTALIESVTFSQDAKQAQRTALTLVPPAKYYSVDLDSAEGATGTDPFKGLQLWR